MRKIVFTAAILFGVIALAACGGQPTPTTATKVNVASGSYTNVTPAQLKQMLNAKDFVFINVHIPYAGEIAQTDAFVPYNEIEQNISKFPADKNAKVFLYCQSGRMSAMAAEELVKRGYTNIWYLDGGMSAWENAGLPLILK
ncbi:MAG: rhodanese-like domain-containing protein [Chloroflexota bacterium]|nr:rhodanese-like domain-containing protein [Chloroflexota bacterium]